MLELYQYEQCPYCRTVRLKLTELGLDFICRNSPPGRPDKDKPLIALSGDTKVPFLADPDNSAYIKGHDAIVDYLEATYGG